jgi:hypothetical protein
MGNDTTLETISILGDVEINMSMGNEIIDGIFKDALYVPRIAENLLLGWELHLEVFSKLVNFFVSSIMINLK